MLNTESRMKKTERDREMAFTPELLNDSNDEHSSITKRAHSLFLSQSYTKLNRQRSLHCAVRKRTCEQIGAHARTHLHASVFMAYVYWSYLSVIV